ncbi:MAG TPA: hypothetical protein VFB74_14605 [Kribbellaceae bacterium]|nr:hypothetical protein [Kribbellaceae bacterium]
MSNLDYLRVPWRIVALSSLLLNLVAIAAIATIANVQNADALATVALALSVLAFISQLIIYSVQTWQSGEQLRQAKELNAQTLGVLSDARARIEGTHKMVSDQYAELMHLTALKARSVIEADIGASADRKVDASTVSRVIDSFELAHERVHAGNAELIGNQRWSWPIPWPTSANEVRDALLSLQSVDKASWWSLIASIDTDILSQYTESTASLLFTDVSDTPLIKAGLVRSSQRPDNLPGVVITEKGRIVGRLWLAEWPPPSDYADLEADIKKLRNELEESLKGEQRMLHERTVRALRAESS